MIRCGRSMSSTPSCLSRTRMRRSISTRLTLLRVPSNCANSSSAIRTNLGSMTSNPCRPLVLRPSTRPRRPCAFHALIHPRMVFAATLFLLTSPARRRRTRTRSTLYSKVSWRAMASIRLVRLAPNPSPKGKNGSPSLAISGCPSRWAVRISSTTSSLTIASARAWGDRLSHQGCRDRWIASTPCSPMPARLR